ncbi:MAG: hypothetical protein KDD38_11140, partial [Bdellovibrionales bacterium]|nr:hypothetical protein [Bdellovibrionales bacterium]
MSKISLKTYILALGLLISLSSRQSYAQFCHADIDGQIQINTELLELPADLQNDYAKLAGKLKALGQYVARLKERTLVLTPTKGEEKLLSATSYKNELMAVQTEVLNLLNQIPTTHRMAGQVLIEAYFQIADRLMFLEILQAPAQANMSALKSRYSLPVPQEAFENIYPLGLNLPAGLDAQIQNGANSSHFYSLTFSGENVFRALVRGAAQSPITRQNKSAYLDTVRCGLNKILIGKIKINQALLGRANEKLSIHEDTNVCLQTSATEFENLSKDDIEIRKEKLLRGVIAEELPQLFSGLSSSAVQIFNSTRLGELIGQLRLFPDWLSELNANRTESEPEVTPSELTQIVNEINL